MHTHVGAFTLKMTVAPLCPQVAMEVLKEKLSKRDAVQVGRGSTHEGRLARPDMTFSTQLYDPLWSESCDTRR
jgi:hypothetical protein